MLVVLDGDDTLWETERLYDEARDECKKFVSWAMDGDEWEELAQKLDRERVAELGFSPERFPGSCKLAYEQLSTHGVTWGASSVYELASAPFERKAELYHDVKAGVQRLRHAPNIRLVLYTKGDPGVQNKRVQDSGLRPLLHSVVITDKSKDFTSLLRDDAEAWTIGNSFRSDIIPAIQAGYSAVWVDRYVWAHEKATEEEIEASGLLGSPQLFVCDSFSQAVDTILKTRLGY